jgi:hypothetical protein
LPRLALCSASEVARIAGVSYCTWLILISFLFSLLVGLGFEFRASHLQIGLSATGSILSVHFALVILEMKS